jgi:hypothetical protein
MHVVTLSGSITKPKPEEARYIIAGPVQNCLTAYEVPIVLCAMPCEFQALLLLPLLLPLLLLL